MEKKINIRQTFSADQLKTGKFSGIAYTGAIIPEHGWFKNLIIDLSETTIGKKNTPVLLDHNPEKIAGRGQVTIVDNQVLIDGSLSMKTEHGKNIKELSEDEIDWEMSLGIYGGRYEEVQDEIINGLRVVNGVALRGGKIREVSFVILGADDKAEAEVFNVIKKESQMKLQQNEGWAKFACSCGGKETSTPEEITEAYASKVSEVEEKQKEIEAKETELSNLKKDLEAANEKLSKIVTDQEIQARKEKLEAKAKEKGLELAADVIEKASKSEDSTSLLLSTFDSVKTKVSKEFSTKVTIEGGISKGEKDAEKIRLAADQLVKDGKAKSFTEAISLLNKGE